jgi:ribosome-binding factor A
MAGNRPGGQRAQRVADAILEEVADLLRRRVKDPRVGFVTLTGVEVAPDLRHAKVFYSVVGDPAQRRATQKGLDSATPFVQGEVGRRLRLRNTPVVEFRFDESLERGQRIEQLLREAGAQGAQAGGAPSDPGAEPPAEKKELEGAR